MLPVIKRILAEFGEDVFKNMQRTNAMLMDLAPGQMRERILVRNFIEADGYESLTRGDAFVLVEQRLLQQMTEVFSLEKSAALWVIRLFGVALGQIAESEWTEDSTAGIAAYSLPYLHGQLAFGKAHVVAVATDGTVFAGGADESYQCNVAGWRDVVAVAAGDAHTLGLKSDGTVLAAGSNAFDQCDVVQLSDVVGVYAFGHDSIFVFANGKASAVGRSKWDLSNFEHITSIAPYP